MKSKFGMKYDLTVKPGSSVKLGTYKTDDVEIVIKKGYFGGYGSAHWSDENYLVVLANVEFRDGCSSSTFIVSKIGDHKNWRTLVEKWLSFVDSKKLKINTHLSNRDDLYAKIKPLEKRRSNEEDELFNIIKSAPRPKTED